MEILSIPDLFALVSEIKKEIDKDASALNMRMSGYERLAPQVRVCFEKKEMGVYITWGLAQWKGGNKHEEKVLGDVRKMIFDRNSKVCDGATCWRGDVLDLLVRQTLGAQSFAKIKADRYVPEEFARSVWKALRAAGFVLAYK